MGQVIHSIAQGKVGSGFDVASAVYGSHVYERFSKEVMSIILGDAHHPYYQRLFPEAEMKEEKEQEERNKMLELMEKMDLGSEQAVHEENIDSSMNLDDKDE